MEEKERYYYEEILRDCVMPEGLFEIKDRESNFYLIIEYKKDVDTIINSLNQQDKRIRELEQENLSLQEQSIRDNQNWIEETTQLKQQLEEIKQNCNYQVMLMCSKENVLLKQQLKQAQNKKAIEELEGLQVQCQFDITFADYKQEQRLYDYINDRIKELKGEKE